MNGRMARAARLGVPAIAGLAVVLLGGVTAPTAAGQDRDTATQQVDKTFAYTCALPEGPVPVTLRATATFPKKGVAGKPVTATDGALTVTVPPAGFTGLPGAATATAVVRWDTAVLYGDAVDSATWTSTRDLPIPLSATENTAFDGPADVPPVEVGAAGDIELAASGLSVIVTGYTAEGAVLEPPTTELTCTLDEGQNAGVVAVPVAAPGVPSRGPVPDAGQPGINVGPDRIPAPQAAGEIPKECHRFDAPPEYLSWFCAYITGFANVNKLHASVLQPPGIQNIGVTNSSFKCAEGPRITCFNSVILPDYQGEPKLPPAPGTFRAFGLVPTSGSMQLTQLAPATAYSWGTILRPYNGLTTIKVQLSVQIQEVRVYDRKVEVGPNCRSAVPIDATLYGVYPDYWVTLGGPITGKIDVPPFSGCGLNEDMDDVITGLVSGPDNFVKITQGAICYFGNGTGKCPPPVPEPKR